MSNISFVRLFSVLSLTFAANALSASTTTYEVGTCMPGLPSFPTISAALAAVPSGGVVKVCPGTYNEQIEITMPVTLEGVSNADSAQTIIAVPSGGLAANTSTILGPAAAQLWVNDASGPVNISDLTVDASGNGVSAGTYVVGIFYQDSSGTVNHVAMRNQSGNGFGIGIFAEGLSSNPSVTIENASVHDFDFAGILAGANSATPELTAVIKGNEVTNPAAKASGIFITGGATVTITSNLIVNPADGILMGGGTGSVSGNTVVQSSSDGIVVFEPDVTGSISGNTVINAAFAGISDAADGVSVTSNKIFASARGISVGASLAPIKSNTITKSPIGIDFRCDADPNVHSNIIMDTGTALNAVPSAIGPSDTYFNVGTIRTGGC